MFGVEKKVRRGYNEQEMSTGSQVLVSVVIPLLNEEENVEPLYERLKRSLENLPFETEVVLVDDGSTDGTPLKLRRLISTERNVIAVRLPRNSGQHRAILEGFLRTRGDVVVTLDGDLQNPPEEIPRLVQALLGGHDVVAGWRKNREDSRLRLMISAGLSLFASVVLGVKMRDCGCMLRAYRREVLESVARYGRHAPFIPTLVTSMGARTSEIAVGHDARRRGRSKYNLAGLISLCFNLLLDIFHASMGFRPPQWRTGGRRIAFFGYGLVGHECLKLLLDMKQRVVCAVTAPDDPAEEIWFPSVRELAEREGIPVIAPADVKDAAVSRLLKDAMPDLVLSVFYRQILPPELLAIPSVCAVNIHPSLLPGYRGRASLNWALIRGEKKAGVTLHYMTEKVDSGDVIAQEEFDIESGDTIATVYDKASRAARAVLQANLFSILEGKAPGLMQNEKAASYFGRRTPEDGRIDWCLSAEEIRDLVRGVTHPFPGAFSFLGGKRVFIWEAGVTNGSGTPGVIQHASDGSFKVGTGRGSLLILRAQAEGGEEACGPAVLEALGLGPGDKFGEST